MTTENDWSDLTKEWQEAPVKDMPNFKNRVRYLNIRQKIVVGFEIILNAAALVFVLYLFAQTTDVIDQMYLGGFCILVIIGQYYSLKARVGTWSGLGHRFDSTPLEQIEMLIIKAKAGVLLIKYTFIITAVSIVFIIIFEFIGQFYGVSVEEHEFESHLKEIIQPSNFVKAFVIGLFTGVVISLVGCYYWGKRKKAEIVKLEGFKALLLGEKREGRE
jgi:hypothetical protein